MSETTTTQDTAPRLLYDRKEAARQLSISIRSLDYMVASKQISARYIGSRVLIPHSELVRLATSADLRSVADCHRIDDLSRRKVSIAHR